MKTRHNLNNVERGKLLADLFPDELQGILDAIPLIYETLSRNKADIAGQWNNPLITFDSWFRLATGVNTVITEQGSKLLKSKRFSDELFDGYYAFFTIDCMVKYAEKERKDSNFYHMVIALFSYER